MAGPYQRLLLATEQSEHDAGSDRLAMALAQRCGLPLAAVLPMLSNPEYEAVAPALAQRDEAMAAQRLAGLGQLAQSMQVQCRAEVRRGESLFQEVVDEARRLESDLLIIRRRGRKGLLANLLVGEMVHQVLIHAPCSVLVTPRQAQLWQHRILLAIDPESPDPAAIEQAVAVAVQCRLPVTVVAAIRAADRERAAEVLQAVVARVRLQGPQAQAELLVGKPHEKVIEAARTGQADLIVVGRRSAAAIGRAWLGGISQKIIGLADCPVLVAVSRA